MVDTKTAQEKTREALYASLGAGQVVAEKARDSVRWVRYYYTPSGFRQYWGKQRKQVAKGYGRLVHRGRKLAHGVTSSGPAKRAAEQTKTARTQVKAAATSVGKAVGAGVDATRSAAKKVG